jgi:hypothetical protein
MRFLGQSPTRATLSTGTILVRRSAPRSRRSAKRLRQEVHEATAPDDKDAPPPATTDTQ